MFYLQKLLFATEPNRPARVLYRRYALLVIIGALIIVAGVLAILAFNNFWRRSLLPTTALFVEKARPVTPEEEIGLNHLGRFSKWDMVEIPLYGPAADVRDEQTNPFQIAVDVTFSSPDGQRFVVPAFYDGDGNGGDTGNVWKVRFSAGATGQWRFTSASSDPSLGGYSGSFEVVAPTGCKGYEPGDLPNFSCAGRLQGVEGSHYLKFADGGYWIKGGIDDPENFLGDAFGGWAEKRAAIDFLSSQGVNSIYLITNNLTPGDRNDTWPWLGDTPQEAKRQSDRFDLTRLEEWEDFFSYVQSKGIVLHVVLDDDGGWHDYDHFLYYREMVARFGHHPALVWNIGEEANENYWDSEQIRLAQLIGEIDPYDHPITVHRKPPWPFFGEAAFDLTSIQPGDGSSDFTRAELADYNRIVQEHRARSIEAGHPIPVMIDETPRVRRVNEQMQLKMRAQVLYPIYLGGGNYEMHFHDAYSSRDDGGSVTIEELEPMLDDMHRARQFLESVPFHEMEPCNSSLAGPVTAYCLGREGAVYVVYSSGGGKLAIDLSALSNEVQIQWFNPRTGAWSEIETVAGGLWVQIAPPFEGDAAVIIRSAG